MGFLSVFQIQIKKINKLLKHQTFGAGQFLSQTYSEKLTDIKKIWDTYLSVQQEIAKLWKMK